MRCDVLVSKHLDGVAVGDALNDQGVESFAVGWGGLSEELRGLGELQDLEHYEVIQISSL